MEYIWKKFPEEIIKGDNITESGFNYEEEYEKRVTNVNLTHYQHANYFCVSSEINTEFIM
jgi:hypothetical protein